MNILKHPCLPFMLQWMKIFKKRLMQVCIFYYTHCTIDCSFMLAGETYPNSKHKVYIYIITDDVITILYLQQAALLIHKGEDNEKFATTNNTRRSELAYQIIHHPAFYWFNLLTALALLLLAVEEEPSVDTNQLSKGVELVSDCQRRKNTIKVLNFSLCSVCTYLKLLLPHIK